MSICTVPGVAYVERLSGAEAAAAAPADLLVEVPHGADRREHYDALRARLWGSLPEDLHVFFHANTDEGAWALGRAVAEAVIAARPERSALLVRCLIPRTFIDCNRVAGAGGGDLREGAVTPGVPPYVRDARDRALLDGLRARYLAIAEAAHAEVCGAGGRSLIPHTYAPRSVGIAQVDDQIVENLRWAWSPERAEGWPIRPPVDLITRTPEGVDLAIPGAAAALEAAYGALGIEVAHGDTYHLHPATQGAAFAAAWPGQTLCLEVRRDLLAPGWRFDEESAVDPAQARRFAAPLADLLAG